MRNPSKLIILIGGSPTAGKSTLAKKLASYINLPWISTDQIREIMRAVVPRKASPNLFNPLEFDTAEKYLNKFSSEEVVEMEFEQGEATWPGVKKLIKDDFTWETGFIVEGISLLPELIYKDFNSNKNIKTIFLVEDQSRVKDVIFKRGLWDDADTYSDDVKDKEVEWALLFNTRIKTEAEKYGYNWLQVTKTDQDLQTLIELLGIKV